MEVDGRHHRMRFVPHGLAERRDGGRSSGWCRRRGRPRCCGWGSGCWRRRLLLLLVVLLLSDELIFLFLDGPASPTGGAVLIHLHLLVVLPRTLGARCRMGAEDVAGVSKSRWVPQEPTCHLGRVGHEGLHEEPLATVPRSFSTKQMTSKM